MVTTEHTSDGKIYLFTKENYDQKENDGDEKEADDEKINLNAQENNDAQETDFPKNDHTA